MYEIEGLAEIVMYMWLGFVIFIVLAIIITNWLTTLSDE